MVIGILRKIIGSGFNVELWFAIVDQFSTGVNIYRVVGSLNNDRVIFHHWKLISSPLKNDPWGKL